MYELFCERLRQQMIDHGVLVPSAFKYSGFERPFLTRDAVQKLKERYVSLGILKPRGSVVRISLGSKTVH